MAANVPVPSITAKAALAYDLKSGSILYTYNFDEKLPIASLTKLMTALVVIRSSDIDSFVIIKKSDINVVGSSSGLVEGESVRVKDLLRAMLISSSNDAALALANYVGGSEERFVAMMNDQARLLGLVNTHFSNPVGWDIEENFSNALDLSKIVNAFIQSRVLSEIVQTRETEIKSEDNRYTHKLTSTNKLLLENPTVIGIKTGFTTKALGNLIIRDVRGEQDVVTIVLGSENREEDTQKLLDWLFSVYRWS
jgi:serine-type D-Ala-D-Ala carboxypeptidase (penicillin-binding protein 5/6)